MTGAFCRELVEGLTGFISGSTNCAPEEGYDVVITPFLYPDRDNVEVFVQELSDGQVLLTDLGQTLMKLSMYGFNPGPQAPRRRAMIHQIVSSMNVNYEKGNIVATVNRMEAGPRLWDFAIAVQRLSDLVFTVPGYTKATFSDEFEDFAIQTNIPYQRAVQIQLPTHVFTADFYFHPPTPSSLGSVVLLVSAGSSGYARERVNSVYTNFSEMRISGDERQRLAVIDDRTPFVDSFMRSMLSHQADGVYSWSRRGALERALSAA